MALPLYYNWRNLLRRRLSTALTFVVVATVVVVLCVLLSFAAGINASLDASGSPRNILVLKPGATAESTSFLVPEEVNQLLQTPGLARSDADVPLASPELCVQTSIPRRGPEARLANVAVRGLDEIGLTVHDSVRIIEGRAFTPGALEIMVGQAARDRYADLDLGDELTMGRLANRAFKVVGVFEAGGSALESEVWAPRTILADAYARRFVSSVVLRMADPARTDEAMAYINGPTVQLDAKRETDYYAELAQRSREIVAVTSVLIAIMAIGAAFAVANTMYAAVDARRREIAMLRTLGFQRPAIILAFLIESLTICGLACVAGLGLSLLFNVAFGSRHDFLSDTTWTVLAFDLHITPGVLIAAILAATFVAVGGAIAPAWRAARTRVIEALRKA